MPIVRKGRISIDQAYDPETGEVEDVKFYCMPAKNKSAYEDDWMQLPRVHPRLINTHADEIGLEGIKVFNVLLSELEFENAILISQTAIAQELGMHKQHVNRAIKRLCEIGFIRKGPKHGRTYSYELHPRLAWRGKAREHHKANTEAIRDGWKLIEGGLPPE